MKIDKILVPATLSHFTIDCTGTRPFCIFVKMFVTCFTGQNFYLTGISIIQQSHISLSEVLFVVSCKLKIRALKRL